MATSRNLRDLETFRRFHARAVWGAQVKPKPNSSWSVREKKKMYKKKNEQQCRKEKKIRKQRKKFIYVKRETRKEYVSLFCKFIASSKWKENKTHKISVNATTWACIWYTRYTHIQASAASSHLHIIVCVRLSVSCIGQSQAHIGLHVSINTRHEMLASSTWKIYGK